MMMKLICLCLSTFAILFGAVFGEKIIHEIYDEYKLQELDRTVWLNHRNFTEFIDANRLVFVAFVDPKCPHCKALMVEMVWAADQVANLYNTVPFAKVDVTRNPGLAKKFEIDATPAIYVIEEGVSRPWTGKTDANYLSQMVKQAYNLMITQLSSVAEVDSFLAQFDQAVIGAFDDFEKANDKYQAFKVASQGGEARFGRVSNGNMAVLEHLGMAPNTIELFSRFTPLNEKYAPKKNTEDGDSPGGATTSVVVPSEEEAVAVPPGRLLYDGPATVPQAIESFLVHAKLPYLSDITVNTVQLLFRSPFTSHVMLFADPKAKGAQGAALLPQLRALANMASQYERRSSSAPKFAFLSTRDKFVRSNLMTHYGVIAEDVPCLLFAKVHSTDGTHKYKMDVTPGTTREQMEAFLRRAQASDEAAELGSRVAEADVRRGAVAVEETWPRHYRSQPVLDPEFGEDMEEYVKILVGRTFEQEVLRRDRDVLVFFHAPWCPHCRALRPLWSRCAEALYDLNPNLVVAKLDATLNELADFDIPAFPMIVMFPANATSLEDGIEFKEAGYEVPDYFSILMFARETAVHPVHLGPTDELGVKEYLLAELRKASGADEWDEKDEL